MPDLTPDRVQLARSKGWEPPANTLKVDRAPATRAEPPLKIATGR